MKFADNHPILFTLIIIFGIVPLLMAFFGVL